VQHIAYVGEDRQIHEVFWRIGAIDPQWEHNTPSVGQPKVAAGTSPTSWYTTPENVQHIAYVGEDRQIHEVFWRIGAIDPQWEHNTPSAGQPKVAAGTSPTSWYTTPENVQHIAYVGEDQQIHEAFWIPRFVDPHWEHNTPGAGRPKVAAGTSPTSWYTTPENVEHIAYVGEDFRIHEVFWRVGGGTQVWDGYNVPSAGRPKVAAGTSPTSWYTYPENVQHIAYVAEDQQIHEVFHWVGGRGGWEYSPPGPAWPKVAAGTSPTSWYTYPENVQHIAYVADDQQIHEVFYHSDVHGPASLSLGVRSLTGAEEQAGIRLHGSTTEVDYEQLAGATPNENWSALLKSLKELATAYGELRDTVSQCKVLVQAIRVYERLTPVDPVKFRPQLAEALFRLFWNFGSEPVGPAALPLAEQGVREYETLAGLRPAGSTAPVDYDQLAGFTPNQYWEWPLLTGALQNMATAAWTAEDRPGAAAWKIKQIRVYERLTTVDPVKFRPQLANALFLLFWTFGFEPAPGSVRG
ncbi:hypothetical protein ACFC58_31800, partial [Kitasatospora purpeofusca]|uniref:hypothetical protein n=1 Tax=Kitasatospora purpeofusca TaxID=67352 RepID=UPI0035D665D9